MSLPVSTQSDLYEIFKAAVQDADPSLTDWTDGSDLDTFGGASAVVGTELTRVIVDKFAKTFFALASGPEVTGGDDDLAVLAVDHFGESFGRPGASKAIDIAIFSRANNSKGAILIQKGTIIKTLPDANGQTQRYETDSDVTLTATGAGTDLTITVGITAKVAGVAGNASAGTITAIESSLTDSSIIVTNTGNATGTDAPDDSIYRAFIQNLIQALAGATSAAVAAKALTVPGVATATPVETVVTVIQYIIATGLTTGSYFNIPSATLYVADITGSANQALIDAVTAAIASVRACGAYIPVKSGSAQTVNWTAHITLNPSGPNYTELSGSAAKIILSMKNYINSLPVGTGFVVATANAALLAIWGSAGTNDLSDFSTSIPSGDVSATAAQKMVAGTVVLS